MELMESLEYARAYIDDLLCISRNSLEYHLEKKLEEVLRRFRDADLKVNAASEIDSKVIFMGHEIVKLLWPLLV